MLLLLLVRAAYRTSPLVAVPNPNGDENVTRTFEGSTKIALLATTKTLSSLGFTLTLFGASFIKNTSPVAGHNMYAWAVRPGR